MLVYASGQGRPVCVLVSAGVNALKHEFPVLRIRNGAPASGLGLSCEGRTMCACNLVIIK